MIFVEGLYGIQFSVEAIRCVVYPSWDYVTDSLKSELLENDAFSSFEPFIGSGMPYIWLIEEKTWLTPPDYYVVEGLCRLCQEHPLKVYQNNLAYPEWYTNEYAIFIEINVKSPLVFKILHEKPKPTLEIT